MSIDPTRAGALPAQPYIAGTPPGAGKVDATKAVPGGDIAADGTAPPVARNAQPPAKSAAPSLGDPRNKGLDAGGVIPKLSTLGPMMISVQAIVASAMETNQELKKAAQLRREALADAVQSQAKAAADDIRSSAWMGLVGSIVSGGMQIVGGMVSMKGAVESQVKFDNILKETVTLPDGSTQPGIKLPDGTVTAGNRQMQLDMARQAASGISQDSQARSQIIDGSGKIGAAFFNLGAQQFEARKADHQAVSARIQAQVDNETDAKQAADKMIATVIDKLAEIQRAQTQAEQSILRIGG